MYLFEYKTTVELNAPNEVNAIKMYAVLIPSYFCGMVD